MKTLFEATELATIAIGLVDLTVAIPNTGIHSLVLDCSLEEAFATVMIQSREDQDQKLLILADL